MAIRLQSTRDVAKKGIKMIVYGIQDSGKTTLITTLPRPVILCAEGGLLSIKEMEPPLPYLDISINTRKSLLEAQQWLMGSEEAKQYDSIAIDSISEIGERILSKEKKKTSDNRQAYGEMQQILFDVTRELIDLEEKHVYFSSWMEETKDSFGLSKFRPSLPGKTATEKIPYIFDEIFKIFRVIPPEGGDPYHVIQTKEDITSVARDRSGKLDQWEEPHLGKIINKIMGVGQ